MRAQGFLQVDLTDEDIGMVVSTLDYDGLVETIEVEDGERYRRSLHDVPESSAFTDMPCGVCPVRMLCQG